SRGAQFAARFHPPIEHENKRRGDILNKKRGRDLTSGFSAAAPGLADVRGNQSSEDFLEMFMDDGPSSNPHPRRARLPMPVNVLEHWKAEPDDAFRRLL